MGEPTSRWAVAARARAGSGPGTRGLAMRSCCGGGDDASGCRCTNRADAGGSQAARCWALGVEDRRFGYPVELLQRATGAGWRFVEKDIGYHPRAAGTRSKVSGSLQGMDQGGTRLRPGALVRPAVGARRRQGSSGRAGQDAPWPGGGMERAAGLAAAALLDTRQRAPRRTAWNAVTLHWTATSTMRTTRTSSARLSPAGSVHAQRGDGFAERLMHAHWTVAVASGAPVVQVGMDTPHMLRGNPA